MPLLSVVATAIFIGCGKVASRVADMEQLPDITSVQASGYGVCEENYSYKDDVEVFYPRIDIYGDNAAAEKVNDDIKNALFAGLDEAEIESYPGVLQLNTQYAITYYDESIFSLFAHVDVAQGGTRGAEYCVGKTYSVTTGEELSLGSFGITKEKLQSAAEKKTVYLSPVLQMLHEYDESLYSPDTWIESLDIDDCDTFFLSERAVNLIVPTAPNMHEYNGIMQILFHWDG